MARNKNRKRQWRSDDAVLKREKYSNHVIQSPDGRFLCRSDSKRSGWYLKQGLATLICEEPFTIRLNFEPAGNGQRGDAYYSQEFENKCVNCGRKDKLTSHHIFPYCYRVALPDYLKKHNYHDIVPLCAICHDTYEDMASELKVQLALEFNAPLGGIGLILHVNERTIVKSLHPLYAEYANKIPHSRRQELQQKVMCAAVDLGMAEPDEEFSYDKFSQSFMEELDCNFVEKGRNYKTHGRLVIEQLDDEGLNNLVVRWRQHFLDSVNPQYMPKHWDINRPVKSWGTTSEHTESP